MSFALPAFTLLPPPLPIAERRRLREGACTPRALTVHLESMAPSY
jgi:hypothetical protein